MASETLTINPDLAWRIIDEEVVILKIKTTTYYSLNPVGSHLWKMLGEKPRSRQELLDALLTEFDVDSETAGKDIDELLTDLTGEELLLPGAVTA